MKRIIKNVSPPDFENWKNAFSTKYHRKPNYNDLSGTDKQIFKQELLKEQGFLCCYCLKRIEYFESHIEHFKPQSLRIADEDLNYFNMFVSCEGYNYNKDCCGHKKDNWYDAKLSVNPSEIDVEDLFQYSIDGHICSTNIRGFETISHFGLDSFHLVRARKTAIYTSGLFEDDFDENKDHIISLFSDKTYDGEYLPFCVAVIYCALHI